MEEAARVCHGELARRGDWGVCFGARNVQRIELVLGAFTVALAALSAANVQRRFGRAALGLGAAALGGIAGTLAPEVTRVALLHLHNLVAIVLLFVLFPARGRSSKLSWSLVAALGLALASGVFYRVTLASSGQRGFGTHVFELADWVAPGLRADWALGLTCAFVFLQSVHYLAWLVLIPQRAQRGEGTLAFGMSLRSLLRDFGAPAACLVLLLALALPGAALFGAWRAQRAYLSLANFHAYLELASLTYFWVRGKPR
ncbi:MAG: hypothetical protein QM756_04895 [Polyangiaceae bacterium]